MNEREFAGSWWWRAIDSCLFAVLLFSMQGYSQQSPQKLHHHVPLAVANGKAPKVGSLPAKQNMTLAVVLPLRNQSELTSLLSELYDPSSPNYHHFLTVQEFTDQFSPTAQDYQTVIAYFQKNGFSIRNTSKNRLVLDVSGTVAEVNAAFGVSMNVYRDPKREHTFFSADREPTLNLSVPIKHIQGLNDFSVPQPMFHVKKNAEAIANVTGSGPGGYYLGSDMRATYYGGTLLTGAGQSVGLLEFGGYRLSDVNLTFNNAGQSYSVPINNVLLDGASAAAGSDDTEEVLDIAQTIGMAPGLSQVRVYIGTRDADIFNAMANENICKELSVSWSWAPDDPAAVDGIFREFAAQGQSIFVASGDYGAYDPSVSPYYYPAEDAYVTSVGATHLTTNYGGGPWVSESAWNANGNGSGGGVSPDGIQLPTWQQGVATWPNGGSVYLRNVPDVAMEGDNDSYYCDLGTCAGGAGGTSFAAPRWAGFMALVNQQAEEVGSAPSGGLGFINPSIYSIGEGPNFSADFHDIADGNNDTANQQVWYNAVAGYDLVTGWGSPNGQNLIDALAGTVVPGFWLTTSPSVLSIYQSASGTTIISVTDAGGFAGNVNLMASGLPTGVTASFNPTSTQGTSELILTADSSATVGTAMVTITGTSGTLTAATQLVLTVNLPQTSPLPTGDLGLVNIGAMGNSTPLTLTFTTAGTLSNIAVLTQGSPNLDFTDAGGDTCTVGNAYAADSTCTVNVAFSPKYPGTRHGAVVLTDAYGNRLAEMYLHGTGVGPQTTFNPGSESTIGSSFASPESVTITGDGSIYATDFGSSTIPGGLYLQQFSDGSYTQSQVNCPFTAPVGVAVDGSGALYVADPGVPAVYRVIISNGNCTQTTIGSGFGTPWGVAVDRSGDVYITDIGSSSVSPAVYKEALQSNGTYVQTIVGSGWVAPVGVGVDEDGNLFVADFGIPGVFKETPSGGSYTQTPISQGWTAPSGIAVDSIGNIYVSDAGNSVYYRGSVPAGVYKEVVSGSNYIQTPIGSGWTAPYGLAVDAMGNVDVADEARGFYKEDLADPPQLAFANAAAGTISSDSPKIVTVSNLGTAALSFSVVSYPNDFPESSASTSDCTPSTLLDPGQSCTLSIEFQPTTSLGGNTSLLLDESVSISTNTLNTTATQQVVSTDGTEVLPGGSVNLDVSANPSTAGSSVTFTATVAGSSGGPTPTGTVTFYDGTTALSGAISLTNGVATYMTTSLAVGSYAISGSYSGDGNYSGSRSNAITENIVAAPGIAPLGTTNVGTENVGSTSSVVPLTITFTQAETLGSVAVLTQGAPNLDFTDAGGGTCTIGTPYNVNATCAVNVIFSPKYSGVRYGAVMLSDNSGNVIGTAYLQGTGTGPQTSFLPDTLSSLGSSLGYPQGIAVDGSGNLYIADAINAAVYKETLSNGAYTQSAIGTGFTEPYGVAVDGAGNVYVADGGNHAVYKETPSNSSYVQTVIGYGFSFPMGVAVDGLGNVYVADFGDGVTPGAVYMETLSNGSYVQTKIAGTFVTPQGIAVDGSGNLFVADSANGATSAAVFELTASNETYSQTSIGYGWVTPTGVAVGGNGNVFITDDAYDLGDGFVAMETPQSDGTYNQSIIADSTSIPDPGGIAVDGTGNRYITDNFESSAYRQDVADPPSLSFATAAYQLTSSDSPKTVTVQNIGNTPLTFSGLTYPADFPEAPGIPSDCTSSTSLGAEVVCTLSIDFTPASLSGTNQSTQLSEAVMLTTDSLNTGGTAQTVPVSGTEVSPLATALLTVPANVATVGTSVTFTATVTGQNGVVGPTGTATFYVNGSPLGTVDLMNGTANYSTSSLAVGTDSIAAIYSGDQNYGSATSNSITEQIIAASNFGTESIGSTSSKSFTITFSSRTTIGSISVVTYGMPNLDFTNAGGGTCSVGTKYGSGATCTVNVAFKPLFSGARYGAVILGDSSGNLIQTVYLEGTGIGPQLSFLPYTQVPIGSKEQYMSAIAVDGNGDIYVVEGYPTSTITKWSLSDGVYTASSIPYTGLGDLGDIAVDGSGAVYISDIYVNKKNWYNRVTKEALVNGAYKSSIVRDVAVSHNPAIEPIAVDGAGNVYISDTMDHQILEDVLSGSNYTEITLPIANLMYPQQIAVDASGNLYVVNNSSDVLQDNGYGDVLVESPNGGSYTEGTVVSSSTDEFYGVAVNPSDDVYTFQVHTGSEELGTFHLLKLHPSGSGFLETVVDPSSDNPISSQDSETLAVDSGQNLYMEISDVSGTQLEKMDFADAPSLSFASTTVGATSSDSPRVVTMRNVGNTVLTFPIQATGTNPSVSSDFSLDSITSCPQVSSAGPAGTLGVDSSCTYAVNFTPTTTGTINGSVVANDNALNVSGGAQTIPLSGSGTSGGVGMAVLTIGRGGTPVGVVVPNQSSANSANYAKVWVDATHQTLIQGGVYLQLNAQGQPTCNAYSQTTVTDGPKPQFGILTFDTEEFEIEGCGNKLFTFAVARYTWSSKTSIEQDSFVLQFSSQNGVYQNDYGFTAELARITVTPAVQNGSGSNPPLMATATLKNPPLGANGFDWAIVGGNEAIVFPNGQETISSSSNSILIQEPNPNGSTVSFNIQVGVRYPEAISVATTVADSDALLYGPAPEVLAGPQVTFSSLQGIPLEGTVGVDANLKGSTTQPITISLTTTTGTGSAIFISGGNIAPDGLSTTITSSTKITLKGVTASSTAGNIKLDATVPNGSGISSIATKPLQVTVVAVSISPPQTSGSVPSAYPETGNLPDLSLSPQVVPPDTVETGPNEYLCTAPYFVTGTVTPSNYPGLVTLRRTITSGAWYQGASNTLMQTYINVDDTTNLRWNWNSPSDTSGKIYDSDAPGERMTLGSTPVGTVRRLRDNFDEYAVLGGTDSQVKVGNTIHIFSRSSCVLQSTGAALDDTYSGDNTAGAGTTSISATLQ